MELMFDNKVYEIYNIVNLNEFNLSDNVYSFIKALEPDDVFWFPVIFTNNINCYYKYGGKAGLNLKLTGMHYTDNYIFDDVYYVLVDINDLIFFIRDNEKYILYISRESKKLRHQKLLSLQDE